MGICVLSFICSSFVSPRLLHSSGTVSPYTPPLHFPGTSQITPTHKTFPYLVPFHIRNFLPSNFSQPRYPSVITFLLPNLSTLGEP
ncbi:hypothetical protein HOY80DRAFT_953034 [Tuber brumale]|nr:hypothetical protein HOY80DRAFT_953034 [Tuber brumale]